MLPSLCKSGWFSLGGVRTGEREEFELEWLCSLDNDGRSCNLPTKWDVCIDGAVDGVEDIGGAIVDVVIGSDNDTVWFGTAWDGSNCKI